MTTGGTISEVISRLDEIVETARRERSRLGFFAALYRNVTVKVKEGIEAGHFDDGPRMERFDVIFARRYLAAYEAFRRGERPSRCWQVSFSAASSRWPIVLQHLLLGINAHINLDLGVAAAEVAPGAELQSLRPDFDRINNILGGMVLQVRTNVGAVSPWIYFLDMLADDRAEDRVINFKLGRARLSAWLVAETMASAGPEERERKLALLDKAVAGFGLAIRHPPGILLRLGLLAITLRESRDIPRIIDTLGRT
jgi:hypothetical protein